MFDLAQYDELEDIISEHIADTEATFGPDTEQALSARNRLATLYGFRSDFDRALPMFRDIYSACVSNLGSSHTLTLKLAGNFAVFLQYSGKPRDALQVTRGAYLAASDELPKDNEQVLALLYNMASANNAIGDHEAALQHFRDYGERVAELYGADSLFTGTLSVRRAR